MRDSNGLYRRVVNLFHNLETAGPFPKCLPVSLIPLEQTRPLRYQCTTVEPIKPTESCLLLWLFEFEIYPLRLMSCLQLLSLQRLHGWMLQVEPVIRYQLLYQIYLTIYFVLACCILNFQVSIVLKQEMKMCIENGWCMRLGALMIFTQEVNSISPMVLREEFVTRSRWCLPGFQNGGVDKLITWYR